MIREIGSDFWWKRNQTLDKKDISLDHIGCVSSDVAYISTGRGAIAYILEQIRGFDQRKTALLPLYTCQSVVKPFVTAGYRIFTYPIDLQLQIDSELLLFSPLIGLEKRRST